METEDKAKITKGREDKWRKLDSYNILRAA